MGFEVVKLPLKYRRKPPLHPSYEILFESNMEIGWGERQKMVASGPARVINKFRRFFQMLAEP
jgi:hypothetical protein